MKIVLLINLAVALVGALLLWAGIRRRWVGQEPRCRRCGYDLSTLPLGPEFRCPECGAPLSGGAIRHGTPLRRPVVATVGGLILGSGGVAAFLSARILGGSVPWYPNAPIWCLIAQIGVLDSDPVPAAKELYRRYVADELRENDIRRIIKLVVAEQQREPFRRDVAEPLLDILGANLNFLTESERNAFYQRCCVVRLTHREINAVPKVAIHVDISWRGPRQLRGWVDLGPPTERSDLVALSQASMGLGIDSHTIGGDTAFSFLQQPAHDLVGKFEIPLKVRIDAASPPFSETRTYIGTIDYRHGSDALAGTLVRNPALDAQLSRAIVVEYANFNANNTLDIGIGGTKGLPIGVAFHLTVIGVPGSSSVVFPANSELSGLQTSFTPQWVWKPPATVTIRLDVDEKAALERVSVDRIWGGSLLFRDVPVTQGHLSLPVSTKYTGELASAATSSRSSE